MIRLRRSVIRLCIVAVVLAGLHLAWRHLFVAAACWLDVGERPRSADYVMVLAGDSDTRPFVAAALVKAKLAPKVLVPRIKLSPSVVAGIRPPIHETNRQVLLRRGVPPGDIMIIDGEAESTYDEARELASFLESSPNARVVVVTNHYHTRRARWVFARVLGDRVKRTSFVSAPTDDFQLESWWQVKAGFVAILGEYLKLTYYALRYTRVCYWIGGCAAVVTIGLAYRRLRTTAA